MEQKGPWQRLLGLVVAMAMGVALVAAIAPQARAAANYNPGPVTGIGATPSNGTLVLYWNAPSFSGVDSLGREVPIVEYNVKVTQDGSKSAGTCRTVAPGCTVTGLTNGVSYWVEIRATNSYYYTSWTGGGPFKPCCSVPAAPTNVVASAGDGTATLMWGPPANAAETVGPFNYSVTSNVAGVGCATSALTCSFSGLANGTPIVFAVSAASPYGVSAAARSALVTPVGLPGPPTDVRAYLNKGRADVSWTGPASTGGATIDRYVVVSSPGGLTCESSGALTCKVSGLSNGTIYTFAVTAYNVVGASPASAGSAPARLLAGPGAPASARARVIGTSAVVTWTPPRSAGGLKLGKYTVTSSPGKRTCTTTKTTCTIAGLSLGTRYVFTVVASNAKGPGLPRTTAAVTTAAPPQPTVPAPAPAQPAPEPKPQQPLS